ncbi:MAG: DUF1702 family protein [Proteobacteria bacterium]|nr:DUF1702 family protein [Pseudomonadota bacterium]
MAAALQQIRNDLPAKIRHRLLAIAPDETSVRKRGFPVSDARRARRIEEIGTAFAFGYQQALVTNGATGPLTSGLRELPAANLGFGIEGAAMALAMLDYVTPWNRSRIESFLSHVAHRHVYVAHIGVGWAIARMRGNVSKALRRLDPLLGWLAVDGIGFHEGYFHWPKRIERQSVPRRLTGYQKRAFDQGLGRSLWFVKVADCRSVAETVDRFPSARRADLWSGAGLAAAYAGGADRSELEILCDRAGAFRAELAQGAAFAAKSRQRAGNPAAHTELACRVFCDLGSGDAAAVTDAALDAIGPRPDYEAWRQHVQRHIEANFS